MALPGTGNSADADKSASSNVVLPRNGLSEPCFIDSSGTPSSILAQLTDDAREYHARAIVEGLAFQIVGFQTGDGGFLDWDPLTVIPIDGNKTELISQQFPNPLAVPNYEAIDQTTFPTETGVAFLCRAAAAEALHAWGELAIVASITKSPSDPTEVGTQFMYSVVHMPLQAKTSNHVYVHRIVHQFGSL